MRSSSSAYELAIVVVGNMGKTMGNGEDFIVGKFFSLEVGPPYPSRVRVVSATGNSVLVKIIH